jgi:K+ transporter
VVFGDLGTSPLYTLQTVVQATGGHFTPHTALGILSAIIWTLIITISSSTACSSCARTTTAKAAFWR